MTKNYDLIVVGAGPAGLAAAQAASQHGLNVALLERKTDITSLNRSCGQSLVSMNDYYFGDLVYYNSTGKRISFPANGFSLRYDGPYRNIYSWQFYSPDGHLVPLGDLNTLRKLGDNGRIGMIYDKEVLFRCLLEDAEKMGVDVFPGIHVTEVTKSGEGVNVEGNGKSFHGSYVIAADGANSSITEKLGFNKERTLFGQMTAKSWYVKNVHLPETEVAISSPIYHQGVPSLMVIFPWLNQDEANVMLVTLEPHLKLDEVAHYCMNDHPVYAQWFKGAKITKEFGAVEAIYSPIAEPFRDNVLLAGDAGGTQEIENTGAMISGWRAGNAIATAVIEKKVGKEAEGISLYLNWWKENYIDKYSYEDYVKNFTFVYVLSGDDLDYLFSLMKEPLAPCFNPYDALPIIGQAIQQVAPTIQQERPDILPKLAKLAGPLKDTLPSIRK
jgi:flavin-dependent dehydrogenase